MSLAKNCSMTQAQRHSAIQWRRGEQRGGSGTNGAAASPLCLAALRLCLHLCSHLTNPISDTIAFCAIIVPHCVQAESPRDESERSEHSKQRNGNGAAAAAVSATPSVPSSRPSSARLSPLCPHGPAHRSCCFLTRVDVRGAAIGTLHGGRNLNGRGWGRGREGDGRRGGAERSGCGVECPLWCRCAEEEGAVDSRVCALGATGCDGERRMARRKAFFGRGFSFRWLWDRSSSADAEAAMEVEQWRARVGKRKE